MSRLLRILIGSAAALAVGVAATLIGIHFAPATRVTSESVPVVAPLRVAGAATPTSGTGGLSPVVGQTTVVTPGQKAVSPIGAQTQRQISDLNAADGADPGNAERIVTGDGSTPATPADDPCSPTTGSPASDCPDGVHGAVFADMHYGNLIMQFRANPPHAQHDSVFDCPAVTVSSDQIRVDVITNIPSDVTLTFGPANGSFATQTVRLPGAASDLAAWNAYYASHGNTYNYNNFYQHCVTLTGIRANTDYTTTSVALDSFGRTSDPVAGSFSTRPEATVPMMMAVPLTNSLVYVSVPFNPTLAQPLVRAWVVTPGLHADCGTWDQRQQALQLAEPSAAYPVTSDYLHANNYRPEYTQRLVGIYDAPEGATIVVCVRTFNASAPSWDRSTPTSQQYLTLQSPDSAVPIVTVKRIHLQKAVQGDDISFTGTTQFGSYCGGPFSDGMAEPSAPAAANTTIQVNRVLCDSRETGSADVAEVGATDNIVVTTSTFTPGHSYSASSTLNLARYACRGACATLPPTLDYTIPLASPTPYRPIVSCSDPSGCSNPATSTATGTADLEVTWAQGNTNGQTSWSVSAPDDELFPPAYPNTTQLDLDPAPSIGLSTDGLTAGAAFTIRVDRHAEYRLILSGPCFLPGASFDYRGETGALTNGVASALQSVTGLCPNTTYNATLNLTDDDGHSSQYSAATVGPSSRPWASGTFHTPFDSLRINATFELTSPGNYYKAWGSTGIDLTANGVAAAYDAPFPVECFPASTRAEGIYNLGKTAVVPLAPTIHLNALSGTVQEDLYNGHNHDADCSWTSQTWLFQTIVSDVSLADLERGVVLTRPQVLTGSGGGGDPFELQMHVWATNIGIQP